MTKNVVWADQIADAMLDYFGLLDKRQTRAWMADKLMHACDDKETKTK